MAPEVSKESMMSAWPCLFCFFVRNCVPGNFHQRRCDDKDFVVNNDAGAAEVFFRGKIKHFFRFLAAVRSTPPKIEKNATNGRTNERTDERFTIFGACSGCFRNEKAETTIGRNYYEESLLGPEVTKVHY